MTTPDIRVLYRYSPSQGAKPRPRYFSKELALASFVRAARIADTHVAFLVDGGAPPSVLGLMELVGEVVVESHGSNRSSYRAMVSRVHEEPPVEPLTWFAEDDYLYDPEALVALAHAAYEIPEATWFALSGPTPIQGLEMRRAQGPVMVPPLERNGGIVRVGDRDWHRIDSTTSTFGGRTEQVVRDAHLLRSVPFTGAAWDRTTCLTVQGITPYPWPHVLDDLVVPSTPARHRTARVAWRLGSRVAVNLRAVRRPQRRGVLVAPVAPLVGHMDLPYEDRSSHWDALATWISRWARAQGLPVT